MPVEFGVLGAISAWDERGRPLALKGPRHRAVLARLLVARGRLVPTSALIEDLWDEQPADPVGSIRTFIADLRRVLEPDRAPRTAPVLLLTEGTGYRLRTEAVDAVRFDESLSAARSAPAHLGDDLLRPALTLWRGPAYADVADESWAVPEVTRLMELRLQAIELQAQIRLDRGRAGEAVPDLEQLVGAHPSREQGWRLLALALYRSDRQADALAVLRRARTALADEHGLDPSSSLRKLENAILTQSTQLTRPDPAGQVWVSTTGSFDQVGDRVRLQSTVDLLRRLAVTGGSGLQAAADHRLTSIQAAEATGDVELTARVIGAYDVPAIWSRSDDPDQAAAIVAAAERTLAALPASIANADRARLLATIALESRGIDGCRGPAAAAEAEAIARRLQDPALLAFALNGAFMQSFHNGGQARRRDAIGVELIELAGRHGLPAFQILGELIRLQARSGLGDVAGADQHAAKAELLGQRYEAPLVAVFTTWYQAFRRAVSGEPGLAQAYRDAARTLDGSGMPGLATGLPALAQLSIALTNQSEPDSAADYGPFRPWVEPLLLAGDAARTALHRAPEPPPDHLRDVRWCLLAASAMRLSDEYLLQRARAGLAPGAGELVGGSSAMITLGPTTSWLARIETSLSH